RWLSVSINSTSNVAPVYGSGGASRTVSSCVFVVAIAEPLNSPIRWIPDLLTPDWVIPSAHHLYRSVVQKTIEPERGAPLRSITSPPRASSHRSCYGPSLGRFR